MGNISDALGGGWSPLTTPPSPMEQARLAMEAAGLEPPDEIIGDGKLHRFSGSPGGKKRSLDGWYVIYNDGAPAGAFGCWRSGISEQWKADIGRPLTIAEEMARAAALTRAREARDAARRERAEQVAESVSEAYAGMAGAPADHPYLKRKGVLPHCARITGGDGRLVIPIEDAGGNIISLQYIGERKLNHLGGQMRGGRTWLGPQRPNGRLYIAEGFATAATIAEVTGKPCVAVHSAGNYASVLPSLREAHPDTELVVVADNDKSGVGESSARKAAESAGALVVVPPELGDANDYHAAGHDLLALLEPPATADPWLVPMDSMLVQPRPIKWLVRGWVQAESLTMIHGPSDSGKTFLALCYGLHISSGLTEWHGRKVTPGRLVYLAGEGYHGLHARVAAWCQRHGVTKLDAFISRRGSDLDTPEGWVAAVQEIDRIGGADIIIIDTCNRFMAGDENSAQDVRRFVQAASGLIDRYGCNVTLIHHTGHSGEAKGRARGSSAWRGSLDNEIGVTKTNDVMAVVAAKMKDAPPPEPVMLRMEPVAIDGWVDDEGEAVTSLVLTECPPDEAEQARPSSALVAHTHTFTRAWWASGAEVVDGAPYVSASALRELLVSDGLDAGAVKRALSPSRVGGLVATLVGAEYIRPGRNGWVMVDPGTLAQLLLSKNSV